MPKTSLEILVTVWRTGLVVDCSQSTVAVALQSVYDIAAPMAGILGVQHRSYSGGREPVDRRVRHAPQFPCAEITSAYERRAQTAALQ
jgi:hypothetical protein